MKTEIIARLERHIADECTPVDREGRFNDMLDQCYDFSKVGGPFENMTPSRVLLEVDPIAHRCGVNDYADGEEWVEVDGETYEQDAAEAAKQEFLEELETEASSLESDLDDAKDEEEPDAAVIAQYESEIAAKRAEIAAVEKYSY